MEKIRTPLEKLDSGRIWDAIYALRSAFLWNETPPGLDYWCDVCDTLTELAVNAELHEAAEAAEQETNEVY